MKQIDIAELQRLVQELKQPLIASEDSVQKLLIEVRELKSKFDSLKDSPEVVKGWIPRSVVMKYLNYGNTQISHFIKKYEIVTITMGKRIFISQKSLTDAFEKMLHGK
jgi:predicted nuclease with TOPRIM domain